MTLKPKQARFVEEYVLDLNATQAAIRAGYSKRGAQQAGSRLLLNVVIQNAIAERQAQAAEKNEITRESIAEKLDLAYKAAAKFGQAGAMVSAQATIAKLYGLIIEKRQNVAAQLTDDQIEAEVDKLLDRRRRAEAERAAGGAGEAGPAEADRKLLSRRGPASPGTVH